MTINVTTGATNGQMTEITGCVETNNQCLREGDRVAVTVAASTTTTGNNGGPQFFTSDFPGGGFRVGPGTNRQGTRP